MNEAKLFGVYTARFPFLDSYEVKVRPIIVISQPYGQHRVLTVVPVTSKLEHEPVDTVLDGWKHAGLMKSSVARVHRLATILQTNLITELGILNVNDTKKMQAALREFLSL